MHAQYQYETLAYEGERADLARASSSGGAVTFDGLRERCCDAEARIEALTRRQREVFDLIARGLSAKEIARELACSPRTVEIHRQHILMKLQVRKTADIATLAVYAALAQMARTIGGLLDSPPS